MTGDLAQACITNVSSCGRVMLERLAAERRITNYWQVEGSARWCFGLAGERFESWMNVGNSPAFLASYAFSLLRSWVDPGLSLDGVYRVFADPRWRTRRRLFLAYGELGFALGATCMKLGESRKLEVLWSVIGELRSRIAEMLGASETDD